MMLGYSAHRATINICGWQHLKWDFPLPVRNVRLWSVGFKALFTKPRAHVFNESVGW
jgi:hypothetical protein